LESLQKNSQEENLIMKHFLY